MVGGMWQAYGIVSDIHMICPHVCHLIVATTIPLAHICEMTHVIVYDIYMTLIREKSDVNGICMSYSANVLILCAMIIYMLYAIFCSVYPTIMPTISFDRPTEI
jgi:hypothetical protein